MSVIRQAYKGKSLYKNNPSFHIDWNDPKMVCVPELWTVKKNKKKPYSSLEDLKDDSQLTFFF